MIQEPRVVSIRHSGTRTLLHVLKQPPNLRKHTKTKHMSEINGWIDNGDILLAPYRHPARIWQSWQGEQKKRPGCDYTMDNFKDEHDNLITLHDEGVVIVLLDRSLLDTKIKSIEKLIGRDCRHDYTPKGSQFNTADIQITDQMLSAIPFEYIEFYEGLTNAVS